MQNKNWVNTQTGECYSTAELIATHPNVSFPVPFQPLPGYAPLTETVPPHDAATQRVEVSALAARQGSHWSRTFTVVELTPEEVADAKKARVPHSVARAQGKVALIQAGLWQRALDFVADIADPAERELAEVALHDTGEWRRDSPFLAQAAAGLGLTDEQLDDLFVAAQGVRL